MAVFHGKIKSNSDIRSNVEDAIQALPHSEPITPISAPVTPKRSLLSAGAGSASPGLSAHAGEESAQPLALPTPGQTLGEDARRLLQKTGDTISKPLSAIGRIFSEALEEAEGKLTNLRQDQQYDEQQKSHWADSEQVKQYTPQTPVGVGESGQQVGSYGAPLQTPYKPRVRRVPSPNSIQSSASVPFNPEDTPTRGLITNQFGPSQSLNTMLPPQGMSPRIQALSHSDSQPSSQHVSRTPTPALDLAGIQDEIDQAHDKAMGAARDTLVQIFPGVDNEVIELVLEANEGDLGKSIEGLLEMSSES
jgi:type II secretory pathway pseudopilin PulG